MQTVGPPSRSGWLGRLHQFGGAAEGVGEQEALIGCASSQSRWLTGCVHQAKNACLKGPVPGSAAPNCWGAVQQPVQQRGSTNLYREQLANAVFAYLEAFYNPRHRHSALGYLRPAD